MANGNPVVLVVDDDNDVFTIIKMGFEKAGYAVHGFNDPIEALTHIQEGCKECELLLTDIRMPKMTGFELVRHVKKLRPEMKVVMMTAFEVNMTEIHAVFPTMPIDNVIRKPFVPSKLIEIINPLLPVRKEV